MKTTARESLFLGQIKMATLNLYDMSNSGVKEEEAVDVNDTEMQLDKVRALTVQRWTQSNRERSSNCLHLSPS